MAEKKEGTTAPTGTDAAASVNREAIKTTINLLNGTFEVVATFDEAVGKYVGTVTVSGTAYTVRGKNRHSLVSGAHAKVKAVLGKAAGTPNS